MSFSFKIERASQSAVFSIRQVDIMLDDGDALALLGTNGSGKSTLLRALSLFNPPELGKISVNEEILHDTLGSHYIGSPGPKIIYQSQDSDSWLTLPVVENLKMSPLTSKALLDELINVFKLTPLLSRRVWQLSGGERKRVDLVKALAIDAPVLLMDEPASALSFEFAEALERHIVARRKGGTTFVIVTHSPRFCKLISNRYLFLEDGMAIDAGQTDTLEQSQNRSVELWCKYQ